VLQDSGPSIPYEEIKVVLEEDLKLKPTDIFNKMNKKAIASASLAQVHEA
jgi:predicted unusual protein kinase regulating ubiquinone biosynthesis (AarF/ABC1/UbiB family)